MIELNPVFQQILTTKKRIILVTGGRGAAKSFGVQTVYCLITYETGHLVLNTRYTLKSLELSNIPEFREKIERLEVPQDFKITNDKITNKKSGSSMYFTGIKTSSGDQTANLKSINGLTDWIMEEAEELKDESKFDDIELSVRGSSAQNRIVLIMNPTTKDHWIWLRWFENHAKYVTIEGFKIPISAHPDILHIHTTYLDNPHLPAEYVDRLKKIREQDPEKYRHKVLGGWLEQAEGVVFENWEEGEFDTRIPYVHGMDLGFYPDPVAVPKVAVDKKAKRIYLHEVVYETKLSTDDVANRLKESLPSRRDLIVSDTSEPRLLNELRNKGLNVINAAKGIGSVVQDIRDMQDYRIIVTPESYNLKRELNNYAWNDKKASIPIDDFNHLIDAARYGFRKLVGKSGAQWHY